MSHPKTQHLDRTVSLARNPLCVDLIYFRDVVCVLLLHCSMATVTLALPHKSETESVMVFTCLSPLIQTPTMNFSMSLLDLKGGLIQYK